MHSLRNCISILLLLMVGLLGVVQGNTRNHDESFKPDAILRITQENISQSCLPSKPIVLVNGSSPGPELRIKEGETVWIRVYNDMVDSNYTMHWHGLSMAVSPFSDGAPSASQWPIPPNHFFDYQINVPVGMAGTYFYHSHVGFQGVSATGPFIVEECDHPPYHYDGERIIHLQDVFTLNDTTIEQGLVHSPLVWSGESAMVLVNGKGAGTANGTVCNSSLSSIDVEPGKTYRLRFIGGTTLSFVSLAIEGHYDLEVIEADGSYTDKHNTSFLQISSGQRYSVLLHTKSRPEKQQYTIQLETRERPTVTRSFAVLNYGSPTDSSTFSNFPPTIPPLLLPNTSTSFLEYTLHPHHSTTYSSRDLPSAKEVTRRVTVTVHQAVRGPTIWLENSYPWTENVPEEPYLVSLYKNDGVEFPSMARALDNNGLDPISRAFPAEIGEVIEIVFQNTGADAGGLDTHPWHAHGAHYWDIGSGNGTYDVDENEAKWANATGKPVKRDTTVLYRYEKTTTNGTDAGWRAWRLRITEPGVWMVHCHILQHMIMGMQSVWVMGNETEVLGKVPRPEVEGYLDYGGNVNGNKSHWPQVVEFDFGWAQKQ